MNAFRNADGTPARRIDSNNVHIDANGVAFGHWKQYLSFILHQKGASTQQPLAFVLFGAGKTEKEINGYPTVKINLPMSQSVGGSIQPKDAIMINLGATPITYNANVAMVTRPAVGYTKLSYRIVKSASNTKVFEALKQKPNF